MKKTEYMRQSAADKTFDWINGFFMLIIAVVIFYPLYYILLASFTDPYVVQKGQLLLIPSKFYWGGYKRALTFKPIWRGYLNTLLYTGFGSMLAILVTVFGAYPLSRKDMAFRTPIMLLFSFTMFFSGGLIPSFLLIKQLKLFNTLWAIVLPTACSVWNLIICRTFYESTINGELLDAANIDGCNDFDFFFCVAMPLSKTLIAVMAIYYASDKWNEYFNSMIYLRDTDKYPLQLILRSLLLQSNVTELTTDEADIIYRQKIAEQLKYSVIVVSTLPMFVFYPFMQKYFAKGIMIGSLKG